jgi:hypothetical protein
MRRAIADVSILSSLMPCRKTPFSPKDSERLNSLEEVDIGKLLHLLHIHNLDHLFVVEQNPRCLVRVRAECLPDESNVMSISMSVTRCIGTWWEGDSPSMDACAFVTNDGAELEPSRQFAASNRTLGFCR